MVVDLASQAVGQLSGDNIKEIVLGRILMYPLITTLCAILLLVVVVSLISSAFERSKSKKSRELFADLYVIGKIRKYAEEDGIDLNKELREMRKMERLEKVRDKDLDKVIEQTIKDKISADNEKKLEDIEKNLA